MGFWDMRKEFGVIYTKALSVRMGTSKEGSFLDASITEFINQCSNSSGLIDDYAMHQCILAPLLISGHWGQCTLTPQSHSGLAVRTFHVMHPV